ncbi:hypothetical protein DM01DRAFT_1385086 [Hesseltinella vesiculosa]|uniref:Phospholipid/glycerol acyltransferase domain-containing protein n=1 Tax=Hesseltinella vesiculosa TaxID=101127 RepID=A0A1X2GAL6_9FUNG|nr:hypothetical protein DM01DRAFT_1385086 [Hesseltinella vesiculosa]
MEKYSRWRDPGTGIQPFLPPVAPRMETSVVGTVANIVHYVFGPVQGLIKIMLVLVMSLLYFVSVNLLGSLLMPVPPLQKIWQRAWSFVCLRLILFFAGFMLIRTETTTVRRGRAKGAKKSQFQVKPGDIIVANWTSYVDVIYLAFRFNPTFTQAIPSVNMVRVLSFWQAIRACVYPPPLTPEDAGISSDDPCLVSLKQLQQSQDRPIVVFPEATTTNGRALLKFASPLFEDFKVNDHHGGFHVMAFKYDYHYMSPTYTVGNQLIHLMCLCAQFSNTLRVKFLDDMDAPCAGSNNMNTNDLAQLAGATDLVGGLLGLSLGNMARLRKTNMDVSSKREFMDYYYSRNKKDHPVHSKKRR